MKLATISLLAAMAFPLAAHADSSQPNSTPGAEGRPMTKQGEGTSGMDHRAAPTRTGGATDAGKTGRAGTSGASDSSVPGATNPNEPMGTRR